MDLLVLGAGPAALALAKACANLELQVTVLAPEPTSPWPQSYGAFEEELAGLDLDDSVANRLTYPLVWGERPEPLRLDATYVRFDTARLQKLLLDRAAAAGVRFVDARAVDVEHGESASLVHSDSGERLTARLVVDAMGASSLWTRRTQRLPLGYQTAYGEWLEVERPPFSPGEMSLMDFRSIEAESSHAPFDAKLPTFLYGIPESPRRLFLQETSLAAEKVVSMGILRSRLAARRARLGLTSARVVGSERCVIPLGIGLPMRENLVLPYGAAAGFTHPATGYQLARALQRAPRVAESIACSRSAPLRAQLDAARAALWTSSESRAFQIYHRGLETLLRLDSKETSSFITAFFSLPRHLWLGFMTGNLSPLQVAEAMWNVFARAPSSLRWQLLKGGALASSRNLLPTFS